MYLLIKAHLFFIQLCLVSAFQLSGHKSFDTNKLDINLLPLGNILNEDVFLIKDSLSDFCRCNIKILDRIIDPVQIMNSEGGINPFSQRVFEYLDNFVNENNEVVIAVTDIPFKIQDVSSESSLRGLSKINGHCTIISNEQIIRDAKDTKMAYDHLLIKVVKHEIGHLVGLEHCSDTRCIMTSSFPLPHNFLKSEYFCDRCNVTLQNNF